MTHDEFCAKELRIDDYWKHNKAGTYPGHAHFDLPPITNRQAIKQQKRAEQEKVTMSKAELEKYVQNRLDREHDDMLRSVARLVSVVFCMVLHDKFGFGGKRLNHAAKEVNELMDCIDLNYVT